MRGHNLFVPMLSKTGLRRYRKIRAFASASALQELLHKR